MKLQSLEITNFRGIQKLHLEFPEQVNVLVGVNGVGKSAVLDCTAILLSRLIGRIRSSTGTGRFFTESDINNNAQWTRNEIKISFQGKPVQWNVFKARGGLRGQMLASLGKRSRGKQTIASLGKWKKPVRLMSTSFGKRSRGKQTIASLGKWKKLVRLMSTNLDELRKHVELLRSKLEEDERTSLPLAIYYPVNRAVLDIPLRIRKRHQFDRLAAYDQALSGEWSSFRVFFEWFREREDLENEQRVDKPRFRDPQLRAVRRAAERFLPGFKGLKVRRSPLRMVVEKNREEMIVNQLSDGEKCTLAMVGDLARRMAIANPYMRDPLLSEGVILIDEIDLHLHPGWQRHIIPALKETFPNCQFLLSTHSPQILSHLDRNSIWLLEQTKSGISAKRPADAYGQEAGRILEDLMNVPARPQEIQKQLTDLFLAISEGEMKKAKQILSDIQDRVGTDPDLVKADVLIRRKEVLGK